MYAVGLKRREVCVIHGHMQIWHALERIWEVVCVVSPLAASGCIVFICFVGGVGAAVVSSRLAAEVNKVSA